MDNHEIDRLKEDIGFAFDYVEFSALAEASVENNDYDLWNEYHGKEFASFKLLCKHRANGEAMLKKIEADFGQYVASIIADNAGVTWFDIGGKDFNLDDLSGTIREAHYYNMILCSYDTAAEISEDIADDK
tara:strand:+ start:225 stop:617 length:393 start_codon:yes stop_codon:yes gene_type:complete